MTKRLLLALSIAAVAAGCGSSSEPTATQTAASTAATAPTGKTMGGGPKGMTGISGTAAGNKADERFGSAGK